MAPSSTHDPVALFAFALRENDWVLADLIAASLAHRPVARERLRLAVCEGAGTRASPSSLSELGGWARMSRRLGIGDGVGGDGEEGQD